MSLYERRLGAAKALLDLAKHPGCWRKLSPLWREVRAKIETPRERWTETRYSHAYGDGPWDEDFDTGIGLAIPDELELDRSAVDLQS